MKGILHFIENRWVIKYPDGKPTGMTIKEVPVAPISVAKYILDENVRVEFVLINASDKDTCALISDFYYNDIDPIVSDNFQIGHDGAYEDDNRESMNFLNNSDFIVGIKRSDDSIDPNVKPIITKNKHYSIKVYFETDWNFFAITPAFNLNFHHGFTFEIEWLFFGIYISLFKKHNLKWPE